MHHEGMSKRKHKLRSGEFTSAAPVVAHREARAGSGAIELGAMLDALPNAALLLDGETEQILHWNQPAKALFGLTATEALGMPFRCLVPEHLRLERSISVGPPRAALHPGQRRRGH